MTNDPAESDPAALNSAEDLDEDELQVDPLEEGVEPPEHWSAADRYGTTPSEIQEGENVEQRLREEQPDFGQAEPDVPPNPTASTPISELDESVDDAQDQAEPLVTEEPNRTSGPAHEGKWQRADEAGGSVADEIREPEQAE